MYITSRVESTELIKIAKKSLLGKITEKIYKEVSISEREKCFNQLNSVILSPINELLSRYNLICESNMNDFWSFSKIINVLSNNMELYGTFDE